MLYSGIKENYSVKGTKDTETQMPNTDLRNADAEKPTTTKEDELRNSGTVTLKSWHLYGLVSIVLILLSFQYFDVDFNTAFEKMKLQIASTRIGNVLKSEGNTAQTVTPDELPVSTCVVLDPDISGSYSGDCLNGLAHGLGTAIGKDKYVGYFENGAAHGRGTYTWGENSDWPSMIAEAEWQNGGKFGYSVVSVDANESAQGNAWVKVAGKREGQKIVYRGIMDDHERVFDCAEHNSERTCYKAAVETTFDVASLFNTPEMKQIFNYSPEQTTVAVACIHDYFTDMIISEGMNGFVVRIPSLTNEELMPVWLPCLFSGIPKLSFYELKANISTFEGKPINVEGEGRYFGDIFYLSDANNSAVTITVDIDRLTTTNKVEVYRNCSDILAGCSATILGRGQEVLLSPGIEAMQVIIH